MSDIKSLLAAGDPQQALQLVQQQVRASPGDARLRVLLFQLLCVLGQWQRALAQLEVCGQLDHGALAMVATYREAIPCEALRAAVFAGKTTPLVFGQPSGWVARLIEALAQDARGDLRQAQQLRAAALDEAPASAGSLNGEPFEWIADGDSRLGPVLEAIVNGRYTWVPFDALSAIDMEAPADLRDLVWAPAQLRFANGGESVALLPSRYPGSHIEGRLALARSTEWRDIGSAPDQHAGLGQRVLTTSASDVGLLELRALRLNETQHGAAA
jgi:type VI secretion system protein ImpE